jgi:hypothetical protein
VKSDIAKRKEWEWQGKKPSVPDDMDPVVVGTTKMEFVAGGRWSRSCGYIWDDGGDNPWLWYLRIFRMDNGHTEVAVHFCNGTILCSHNSPLNDNF